MNQTLQAAFEYVEKYGFSVIPIKPGDKRPLVKWEEFQKRKPTRTEMMSWWASNPKANIGIVTGEISNLFVVDFDKYAQDYDDEKAREIIPDSTITPTATTPRGGQHLYFNNPAGNDYSIKARILPGIDYRGNGGFVVAPPSVNGNGKPYAWVEGLGLDVPRADLPDSLTLILNNAVSYNKGVVRNEPYNSLQSLQMFTEGRRDEDLFHTANCLTKGGMPEAEQSQILERIILSWGENPDAKWIQDKIQSAMKRSARKERRISEEIREWIFLTEGYFFLTDAYKDLQILTKEEKNTAYVAINRLQTEGIIQKYGNKRGCYEIVRKLDENVIDIFAADNKPLPVKLPLDVHDLVKIMPKNIIILAGEVNAGKSAYLLNLAAINMRKFETVYFSSEMGGAELKERLQNFDFPLENWRDVKFIERASDFSTAIRPEGLNIIDFLEIHDEFYKVGALIKDIFDKLTTGLAVIAIQKNKGRDEGLGGQRSLEKPRLYMAMEPGKLKIVKAKNWLNPTMNPNGMCMEFKLAKGCYFKGTGTWRREESF
jgi:hypothetical protein